MVNPVRDEWVHAYEKLAAESTIEQFPSRQVFDFNVDRWRAMYDEDDDDLSVRDFLRARLAAIVRLTGDVGPIRIIRPPARPQPPRVSQHPTRSGVNPNIHALMSGLSDVRPVFHFEADFQLALFRHILAGSPDCGARLEKSYRVKGRARRLDIWIASERVAIELKYFTRKLDVSHNGEFFHLKDQAAGDVARHGFLKDLQRLEDLVHSDFKTFRTGFAVLLTNEPSLWNPPSRVTNDASFRLHEGRSEVTGPLLWSKEGCPIDDDGLDLKGSYTMRWNDYSDLGAGASFRYLALQVGCPLER